jgi:hypothetical protein
MKIGKDSASIYVIHNTEVNRVKIGFSNNPQKRFQSIQSSSGCKLKLVYHTPPIYKYSELEKWAHNHFKDYRYIGEWFNLDIEIAVNEIKTQSKAYQVESILIWYKSGLNPTEISRRLGVSRSAIVKYLNNYGIKIKDKSNPLDEILMDYEDFEMFEKQEPEKILEGKLIKQRRKHHGGIPKEDLEEMVRKNNEKRSKKKKIK